MSGSGQPNLLTRAVQAHVLYTATVRPVAIETRWGYLDAEWTCVKKQVLQGAFRRDIGPRCSRYEGQ